MHRTATAALLLATLALSPALAAQTATLQPSPTSAAHASGTVQGRVIDPDGHAVPHATVVLRALLSGAPTRTITDTDGRFTFTGVSAGSYELSASANELTLDARRLVLAASQTLRLGDLRLGLLGPHEQLVVSASRVAELQTEAPTHVLTVTKAEIERTGYERVGDVLSEIPGVVTRAQSFGVGVTAGEQIDGMDSKETLVLLDGLPLVGARGITEGYIDLNQQNVGRLDRVEIVKGAASALYGTDALGGVINLVTREPSTPLNLDTTTSGGSLGAFDTRVGLGTKVKSFTGLLDVEHHQRSAYSLLPNDASTVGPDEHRQDVFLKTGYAFNPRATLGFTSSISTNHQRGLTMTAAGDPRDPASATEIPTTLRANDHARTYALVGNFLPTTSTSIQVRAYSSSYGEDSNSRLAPGGVEGPAFDLGTLHEDYHRADVTVGQQWGRLQFLQGGYELATDEYRGDNRIVGAGAGQHLTTHDLWIQDRVQPLRRLVVTLGGRYQHNSSYGGHFVPKAGAVYQLSDRFVLRGGFGAGFRAPNLGELYYHLLHLDYGYQVTGNPTLRPETSRSYSGGATFTGGRLQLSVNGYRNNLRNLINYALVCDATSGQDCSGAALDQRLATYGVPPQFEYDTTGAAFFTFVNLNVDRATTQGLDLDGRVTLTSVLKLSSAYTFLDATNPVDGTPLPYRSRHQGRVALEYSDRHGVVANVRGAFFGRWPDGTDRAGQPLYAYGYQTWSVYASKSIGRQVRTFVAVDNVANSRDPKLTQATPTFDRVDYGRTFRVGFTLAFARR